MDMVAKQPLKDIRQKGHAAAVLPISGRPFLRAILLHTPGSVLLKWPKFIFQVDYDYCLIFNP